MTLYVADISAFQTNYASIIKANDAVIVKISEGVSYINPLANAQYAAAKNVGKRLGVYHFIVGGINARTQAEYFYNNAKNYINADGVIPILDWERPSNYPALTGDEPKAFMDRLYELSGKRGLIYMSTSDFISSAYNWSDIKDDYGLWIAGYPKNDGSNYSNDLQTWANNSQLYFANAKYDGYTVAMWQYDSVPYDRSVFYGDANAWNKYGSKAGSSSAAKPNVTETVFAKDGLWYTDKAFTKKANGIIKHMGSYWSFVEGKLKKSTFTSMWNNLYWSGADGEIVQGKMTLKGINFDFGTNGTFNVKSMTISSPDEIEKYLGSTDWKN